MEKIYEGSTVLVKASMAPEQAKQLKSLTFKFLADGEPAKADDASKGSEFEKTYAAAGADGSIEHRVQAPKVPGEKDTYVLTYHIFYEVESSGGKTVKNQELSVKQFQVFPRTAKLKAVWDKGGNAGKAFPDFRFKLIQGGAQVGETRHTLANDTQNVNGETIPAGSAEFNLEMIPGYAIVQESPWEIVSGEADAKDKRSYAVKGNLAIRAAFLNPPAGRVKQYVNYDPEDQGQQGVGNEVIVEVGVAGEAPTGKQEIHFRAAFGPEAGGAIAKSKRKDSEHPTKVDKADKADKTAIEEKKAGEKYEGKIELENGRGRIKVCLGRAGGDTCKLEIAGSDKFLKDKAVQADQVLEFENWRLVHYELMVPSTLYQDALDPDSLDVRSDAQQRLEALGRQTFVEFVHVDTRVFDALGRADHGTLGTKRFFGLTGGSDKPAYVLSGRNWRQAPQGETWTAENPGKTFYISLCDLLLKWKKDTADEGAGPKDFSGTLTTASGVIDAKERFQGLFMPFSGYDGGAGVTDVAWTADISKDESCCQIKPSLELADARYEYIEVDELPVEINCGPAFGPPLQVPFQRGSDGRFAAALDPAAGDRIKEYVDAMLASRSSLALTGGKVKAEASCPKGGKGEDACFDAVKGKFKELFDKSKKDLVWHPGLADDGTPRAGACRLTEITDMQASTAEKWHFLLPAKMADGSVGPGAFVGPKKTKDACPVKLEFSFQPHEISAGEAEGKLMAWACGLTGADGQLMRLVLRGFKSAGDKAGLEHGHGKEGKAGDCLEKADAPCEKCLEYGRAASLVEI